jgi:hypothetical protein
MKDGIKWVIEKFDYFGEPMLLNFNKEKKFKTVLGGFLSLIIYGVSLTIIVISGMQLIRRENPNTTYTQKNLGIAPTIQLRDQGTLFIAFLQLSDMVYSQFYDPTYMDIKWNQFTSIRFENGTILTNKTELPSVNCTNYYDRFVEYGLETYFLTNNLHLSKCLDMDLDMKIGGKFASPFYSNIYVTLDFCRNSSYSEVVCKSQEEINNKIYDGYLNLVYFDKYVDVNNYEKPFINYVNTFFQKIDPQLYKKIDLYFEKANVTSDVGFIFADKKSESGMLLERYTEDIIHNTGRKKIMNIYINISENMSLFTRNYMKFQELAALFGGIFQAMKIVGLVITYFVAQHKMYEYMFNSLFIQRGNKIQKHHLTSTNEQLRKLNFFLEERNRLSRKSSLKDPKISQYSPIVSKKNYGDKIYNSNGNKDIVMRHIDFKIKDYQSKFSKKFRYNLNDIIFMYMCGCCNKSAKNKLNIFAMGFKKLLKYLDFLEIIKTLQQFHQLKDIVLTKNQSKLFDYYSKPVMNKDNASTREKNKESSCMELYDCFIKASSKMNKKINRKLIENFDQSLKEIFISFDPDQNLIHTVDKEI